MHDFKPVSPANGKRGVPLPSAVVWTLMCEVAKGAEASPIQAARALASSKPSLAMTTPADTSTSSPKPGIANCV